MWVYLGSESETEGIVVTVVGTVLGQVVAVQLSLRVSQVGVVNPSSSHMGGTLDQLLEAQVGEKLGDGIVGLLVKADVEVPSDDGHSIQGDKLLYIVHHLLLTSSSRPVNNFVRYIKLL